MSAPIAEEAGFPGPLSGAGYPAVRRQGNMMPLQAGQPGPGLDAKPQRPIAEPWSKHDDAAAPKKPQHYEYHHHHNHHHYFHHRQQQQQQQQQQQYPNHHYPNNGYYPPQRRPFGGLHSRRENIPPELVRPSTSQSVRPNGELDYVPTDALSPRSDSFYYGPPTPSAFPSPASPYFAHRQTAQRTRDESSPSRRPPPRAPFPGLSSNPFIPEVSELENWGSQPRRLRLFCDQNEATLSPRSPIPPFESPIENRGSRKTSPVEGNMTVENFSRPRKPSVRSQQSDGALSRHLAAYRLQPEPTTSHNMNHNHHAPSLHLQTSFETPQNQRSRSRGLSGSSSKSSSTFSSIPARPSNDHLAASSAATPRRHVSPGPGIVPPTAGSARLGLAHSASAHPYSREPPPWVSSDETRSSFRSQLTTSTGQTTLFTTAGTERNSVATKASSITEQSIINGYARTSWRVNSIADDGLLDDVMGMYERGFNDSDIESIRRSMKISEEDADAFGIALGGETLHMSSSRPGSSHSNSSELREKVLEAMSDTLSPPGAVAVPEQNRSTARQSVNGFRRSVLATSLPKDMGFGLLADDVAKRRQSGLKDLEKDKHDSAKMLDADDDSADQESNKSPSPTTPTHEKSTESKGAAELPLSRSATPAPAPQFPTEPPEEPGSRDRYGFRKASANVTLQEYDAWDSSYSQYLARRRKKWVAYLKDNSLMTDRPIRFPPRNAKTKRFIRKGIPPDWRGAAWFYYAGGPAILAKHPGVYRDLVARSGLSPDGPGNVPGATSEVKPLVIEDIEKDLYRTFPDNVRFKPPRSQASEAAGSQDPSHTAGAEEPEIITSLRRVLHAFALYNPRIGYCQSLNFLAGLLLLFVETEEQSFWLLNVITRVYLPGTHEMSLEGSKVDLGVLMVALKDSLPGIWKQIGGDEMEAAQGKRIRVRRGQGKTGGNGGGDPNRLPAITLCMTAWFMSCFIGTLPTETVLRVWDVFFYEGSRTLFRIALTIFKLGEAEIKAVTDPMEMFGVVQAFPRRLLDCNTLMDTCYKRRNGIGHLTQEVVEERRQERRDGIRKWKVQQEAAADESMNAKLGTRVTGAAAELDLAADLDAEVRRKNTLFGRRKDREQVRAAEVM